MVQFGKGKIVRKVRKDGIYFGTYYKIVKCGRKACDVISLQDPTEQKAFEKSTIRVIPIISIRVARPLAIMLYVKAVRKEPTRGKRLSLLETKLSEKFITNKHKIALFYSSDGLYKVYGSILTAKEYMFSGKPYVLIELDKLYTL